MMRGRTTGSTAEWKRWLLALTLCFFALVYGAPNSVSAHERMSNAAMNGDCSAGGAHHSKAAREPNVAASACCIAHCLPAIPISLPFAARMHAVAGAEVLPRDEYGEGWSAPVLLPPPRA